MRLSSFVLFSVVWALPATEAQVVYGDRWNYEGTVTRADGFIDYGPEDWGDIECDESSVEGLDACLAYTDKWHTGQGWASRSNTCRNCPFGQDGSCGSHRNSPINLERNRGLGFWEKSTEENNGNPGDGAHPLANECIDVHWMKYEDAFCPLDQLIAADSFTIERHALRIRQPITVTGDDVAEINCRIEGKGSRFGRIDFSKGFSQYWYLSHIDIHTPSEHTQDGKRYDAELQLHHFYSVSGAEAGVDNELGTVSMFLQAYDNAPPSRDLDQVICQWRRKEYEVRTTCGVAPVTTSYPGCFPVHETGRKLRANEKKTDKTATPFQTVQDLILAHDDQKRELRFGNDVSTTKLPKLHMGPENWAPSERTNEEWADFIAEHSARFDEDDQLWKDLHAEFNGDHEKAHEEFHIRGRKLIEGSELTWFNYWPMLGVRTEYYFRYSGTQTIPPCYGDNDDNSRKGITHWRVMKDPLRIHRRQLAEIQRLIKDRIAPSDDPVMACRPDTAAGTRLAPVDTARPLQFEHESHFIVFCECKDWPSKWPEDRQWCAIENINERFYSQPYNFATNGF